MKPLNVNFAAPVRQQNDWVAKSKPLEFNPGQNQLTTMIKVLQYKTAVRKKITKGSTQTNIFFLKR